MAGLDLEPLDRRGRPDVALGLVLPCWTLLGMLDRALELTRGLRPRTASSSASPSPSFQGVQFQLTDAEVERVGPRGAGQVRPLEHRGRPERSRSTTPSRCVSPPFEAAEIVFRVAHQLHGAIGFCDETALSWVSRASVPLRRLPFGVSSTRAHLARQLGREGLVGLFPPGTDALTDAAGPA